MARNKQQGTNKPDEKAQADKAAQPAELPNVKVRVLIAPLPFAEGGHKLVTYPAGHRVADMSDDAQAWLVKNDLDEKGEPGVFTELAELPDAEGAKLAADIGEAQKAVDAATVAAQEAANAFVTAKTAEEVQAAQEANNNASTVLSAAQRKLNNLSNG